MVKLVLFAQYVTVFGFLVETRADYFEAFAISAWVSILTLLVVYCLRSEYER